MGCSGSSKKDPVQGIVVPNEAAAAPRNSEEAQCGVDDLCVEQLTWSKKLMSSGADKDIFAGSYLGEQVAVCVAKSRRGGGFSRIKNEIKVFKVLGIHPHIIRMYTSGKGRGALFLALEIVEPIGYDLDRLTNMYSFAGQTVPSTLMARIHRQLISALGHMHRKGIIHRDLKTENVLIDAKHNAKLIDMGIACKVGTRDTLRSGYLAPELCEGKRPLGVEVDYWGLGLILHQVYQNQWKVLSEHGQVRMLEGKPSNNRPMEKPLRDAMCGLLQFQRADRWTLQQLEESEWLKGCAHIEVCPDWQKVVAGTDHERLYLRRYVSNKPLPTALAVYISRKNHAHVIGKPIRVLGLSANLGVTVLLINYGDNEFERVPGATTPIKENSWLYFGVPQSEQEMAKAISGLSQILRTHSQRTFRALSKQEVIETGKLVEFTIEFDCFSFPNHIGSEAMIGSAPKCGAMDLRRLFKINLVGIHHIGQPDPQWFPRASATVNPEDLGLVVREPCNDGSTKSTLTDEDMELLMNEEQFKLQLRKSPQAIANED